MVEEEDKIMPEASSIRMDAINTRIDTKIVKLTKLDEATSGYVATYKLEQGGVSLGKIDIPKDFLVKSATLATCSTTGTPSGMTQGDKYIDFIINVKEGSANNEHVYVKVTDLVDVYTADNSTLQLSNHQFSIKNGGVTLAKLADAVYETSYSGTKGSKLVPTNDSRLSNARTPTSHTDSSGAYGKATTSVWGHTKLNSATNSTDETTAATPKAVKAAYDLANGKPSLGTTSTTAAKGDHVHSTATSSSNGFMSSTDKGRLDGIEDNANKYVHPTSYGAKTGKPTANQTPAFGGTATVSQITSDASGHVTGATDRTIKIPNTLGNGTTAGLSTNDYTNTEKTKLDGIEANANKYIHPNSGVTAGTNYSSNQTPSFNGTFNIPKLTFDSQGHITASANSTVKIPALPATMTPSSHSHGSLSNGGVLNSDISSVNKIAVTDSSGNLKTISKLPADKVTHQSLASKTVTVTKETTPNSNAFATYTIKQNDVQIGQIDIPKDFLVKSGSVKTVTSSDLSRLGSGYEVGDKYIDLIINTTGSSSDEHLYINVQTLVESRVSFTQTKQSGIEIGRITIDGVEKIIYQQDNNTTYTAATQTPQADATTGNKGSQTRYAREDHIHPKSSLYAEASHSHTASDLPTASTEAKGIVQLGTGSSDAAKGDHTHQKLETQSISANADLNTYRTPGIYKTILDSDAKSMFNTPWGDVPSVNARAFNMVVLDHAGVKQIVMPYQTTDANIYMRNYYYNGQTHTWGSWYTIYTSGNIPSATTSVKGITQLSDNYTSSAGAASASVGASSKAVYDTYNTLNTNKISKVSNNTNILLADGTNTSQTNFVTTNKISNGAVTSQKLQYYGLTGGVNDTGYLRCLQITLTKTRVDSPIDFDIYIRQTRERVHCSIQYVAGNVSNPNIRTFVMNGSQNKICDGSGGALNSDIEIYAVRESASVWSICVKKMNGSQVDVHNITIPAYMIDKCTITSPNTMLSSLPSLGNDCVKATYIGFSELEKTKLAGIETGANNYSHPTVNSQVLTGVPTQDYSLSFGARFNVSQPVANTDGHVTAINPRWYTLPTPINDLTSGGVKEALSAEQGKSLKAMIDNINDKFNRNSVKLKIGRSRDSAGEDSGILELNRGEYIYVKLYCNDQSFDVGGKLIILNIDGQAYTRTTNSNGKTSDIQINLNSGDHVVIAFRGGYDDYNSAIEQNILRVA